MKENLKKKNFKKINIILYTIIYVSIVFYTIIISNDIFESISYYPKGNLVISRAIMTAIAIVVILLLKKTYVFTQKKESLKTGLFYGSFYLVGSFLLSLPNLIQGFTSIYAFLNLLIGCFLVGTSEEFLCRGCLLNELLERYGNTKKGIWYSIIISGIFFGLLHIINIYTLGQAMSVTITQVITASATGIFLGLIYYKTRNIWSVVILHGLWDFSLLLNEICPITESTEIYSSISTIGILFATLTAFAELLNIIPYINDINVKPQKKAVKNYSKISIMLFFAFTLISGIFSTKFGKNYKYGNITIENYGVTKIYSEEYKINQTIKTTNKQDDENKNTTDNVVSNNYLFKLYRNDKNNLTLVNLNTKAFIEIECEFLYDYILYEDTDQYILAYIDYTNSANAFLNYVYIKKEELSNDNQYLNNIKNNIKKYLLPTKAKLLIVNDYDNNKSYLGAYHIDYGYYLLVKENEVSILNEK